MASHHKWKQGRLVKNYCLDMRECFYCGSFLNCKAIDSIGLTCFKNMVKEGGGSCSRHGGGKHYWEKGQLIVECKDCGIESDGSPQMLIYDKSLNREECGCQERHDERVLLVKNEVSDLKKEDFS